VFTGSQTGLGGADGGRRALALGVPRRIERAGLPLARRSDGKLAPGAADSTGAKAKPVRTVVANSRPLVFEWSGAGDPQPLAVQFSDSAGQRSDTLRFDGSGHAEVRLPVGTYHYRLEGSGEGTVAVEQYSDEWLPRTVALQSTRSRETANASTSARQWLWLSALHHRAGGRVVDERRLG
jgi:hypothetical protein